MKLKDDKQLARAVMVGNFDVEGASVEYRSKQVVVRLSVYVNGKYRGVELHFNLDDGEIDRLDQGKAR